MKVRLDQLVYERGLAESRTQAAALIMAGQVIVDGVRRDKPGWQTNPATVVELKQPARYVSRAGYKLEAANAEFGVDFTEATVIDVGSSTGGFSDYALQHGAATVYAVDVGTHQLHERLRADSRVVVMEQTDIRSATIPEPADIVVIDVSFISLRQVLPHIKRLLTPYGTIIAMCKPQFEAGVKEATKHKGVIKNDTIRRGILKDFEHWLREHQFEVVAKADSKLPGAKGNVERFYCLHV